MLLQELENQMEEYIQLGVARPLTQVETQTTKCWVQTFGREKPNSSKVRIITNLKPLNQCFRVDNFRSDHWGTVLQTLQNHPHCHWGVTLDLKDWFFHLGLHPQTQRWIRVKGRKQSIQMLALPFGLQSSPFWSHRLSKVILQHLRGLGFVLCWYVDDILLLGESHHHVMSCLMYVLQLLTQLGLRVNFAKSHLIPTQSLIYLGQVIHLAHRSVSSVPLKAQGCRFMAHKVTSGNTVRPCNVASLAGKLLDLQKGAINLVGLPRLLMRQAGKLAKWGWYKVISKPPMLKALLLQTKLALSALVPVQLPHPGMHQLTLTVDACDTGWGGVLCLQGPDSQPSPMWTTHQMFSPLEREHHITWKELEAVVRGLKAFWAEIPHPCNLTLRSDATVAIACFNKGSSKGHLNEVARLMRTQIHQQGSCALAVHLPGNKNAQADKLSRRGRKANDYTCHLPILRSAWKILGVSPTRDMFSADHNHRLPLFWTWRPSPFAEKVNAFAQPWDFPTMGTMFCCPPWPLIQRVLLKAIQDKARLVVCFSHWPGAPWWPLFLSLVEGEILLHRGPMFHGAWGRLPRAPRWSTCFAILNCWPRKLESVGVCYPVVEL